MKASYFDTSLILSTYQVPICQTSSVYQYDRLVIRSLNPVVDSFIDN